MEAVEDKGVWDGYCEGCGKAIVGEPKQCPLCNRLLCSRCICEHTEAVDGDSNSDTIVKSR